MNNPESEDRVSVPTYGDDNNSSHSIFALFSQWISRWFLTRASELELRLVDKDKEIDYLRTQVIKWEDQCIAFQNSILLSKGLKGTSPSVNPQAPPRTVQSNIPGQNLQMEVDFDRLTEKIIYHPEEAADVIGDLLATGKPRDRELAQRLVDWVEKIPDSDNGVLITTT